MPERELGQSDLDELSAWMDGELTGTDARRVERLVQTDPTWRSACDQLQGVADALDGLATPAAPAELTARILRAARPTPLVVRFLRVAAPLAAAAAIVLGVMLWAPHTDRTDDSRTAANLSPAEKKIAEVVDTTLKDVPEKDRFIVANLTLFDNYKQVEAYQEVSAVADDATLKALQNLEAH
jgi:ferric-dicitrate binding protein FerR (iron transport regulator)